MKKLLIITFVLISYIALSQESVWFAKGENAYNKKEYKEALEAFSKVIELNPKNKEANYYRGICYLYLGDIKSAISDFTQAIKLDSNWADAYNNRGLCYGYLGEVKKSVKDFEKAIALDKNFPQAYLNLGSGFGHK